MNILFLTLLDFDTLNQSGIYTDLLRKFAREKHHIYVISPAERRTGKKTQVLKEKNATILKVKIGNIQKTNLIEKGISTITLEYIFIHAIKKYFANVKFNLVLYSTPPITLQKAVEYVKKRDQAQTYLLLKDIFPQNAVDLGMLKKSGYKKLIYRYFRIKEKKLYAISDYIGCMSEANKNYILKHNHEISPQRVEVCPNCIEVQDMSIDENEKKRMRKKYEIPQNKIVFVYGGNLGKPQGIPFLIKCLKQLIDNKEIFILIVGDGTEYNLLEKFFNKYQPSNMKLMKKLPKDDYDQMIASCDVGMIFLDHRFTIPNFPSRLLNYMQAKLPVLAVTDPNTDVGKVIVDGDFGWWCESNDIYNVNRLIEKVVSNKTGLGSFKEASYNFLMKYYTVETAYKIIINKIKM